jgi:hypothetical protein
LSPFSQDSIIAGLDHRRTRSSPDSITAGLGHRLTG